MTDGIVGGIVADPPIGGGLGAGQGIAGPPGPPGPAGPQGPAGIGAATVLTFPITSASSFTASHGFPYQPRVWLVDAANEEVSTDILYAPGQVTAIFPGPFTGTLYLG